MIWDDSHCCFSYVPSLLPPGSTRFRVSGAMFSLDAWAKQFVREYGSTPSPQPRIEEVNGITLEYNNVAWDTVVESRKREYHALVKEFGDRSLSMSLLAERIVKARENGYIDRLDALEELRERWRTFISLKSTELECKPSCDSKYFPEFLMTTSRTFPRVLSAGWRMYYLALYRAAVDNEKKSTRTCVFLRQTVLKMLEEGKAIHGSGGPELVMVSDNVFLPHSRMIAMGVDALMCAHRAHHAQLALKYDMDGRNVCKTISYRFERPSIADAAGDKMVASERVQLRTGRSMVPGSKPAEQGLDGPWSGAYTMGLSNMSFRECMKRQKGIRRARSLDEMLACRSQLCLAAFASGYAVPEEILMEAIRRLHNLDHPHMPYPAPNGATKMPSWEELVRFPRGMVPDRLPGQVAVQRVYRPLHLGDAIEDNRGAPVINPYATVKSHLEVSLVQFSSDDGGRTVGDLRANAFWALQRFVAQGQASWEGLLNDLPADIWGSRVRTVLGEALGRLVLDVFPGWGADEVVHQTRRARAPEEDWARRNPLGDPPRHPLMRKRARGREAIERGRGEKRLRSE